MNNPHGEYIPRGSIHDTIAVLKNWGDIAYHISKQDTFFKAFCPHAEELIHVSWNDEVMKIVYLIEDGQHIATSIPINKWLKFLQKES